jgi:hypothetical protein
LGVLIPPRSAQTRKNIILDQIHQSVRYCRAVVVESPACQFTVHIIQASWLGEPVFFPQFLDDAFAGFCAGRQGGALCCVGELGVFKACCDCCEDAVDCGLDLVFLRFDFEFYVADFHFDFYGGSLRVFCQLLHLLYIVLYKMHMHNT